MIKLRLRRNMIYLLALYGSYFIRKIVSIIIDNIFELNAPFMFLYMMTLGETFGGLAIYYYQLSNWKQKKEVKYFDLKIIHNQKFYAKTPDTNSKKILLIFFAGSFDFLEFILIVFYVPKIAYISPTIKTRLGCLATITSALICTFALKFKIGRHHKLSLIFLGICFLITLILELIFKPDNEPMGRFIFAHFIVIIYLISISFNDCIEKYLAHYNFLNPFVIIMTEGIFEFIMSIFYSIGNDPFKGMADQYEKNSPGKFVLLIFLLIIYLFLSSIVNAYKVYCNVIYTPMARSLTEYFLNPLINIYYFLKEDDFHANYLYFFICEFINIIMDFSFYIFNEYIILKCCGLEYDTGEEIIQRAKELDMDNIKPIKDNEDDDLDNINDDENNESNKDSNSFY